MNLSTLRAFRNFRRQPTTITPSTRDYHDKSVYRRPRFWLDGLEIFAWLMCLVVFGAFGALFVFFLGYQ